MRTRNKILLVDVSGVIGLEDSGLFSSGRGCTPAGIRAVLNRAEEDDDIKGVLLRVNSPGGGVAETDMIHHEIAAFRSRRGVPVRAAIMDLGCSGGYYVSMAAEHVDAMPTAVVGSIGVIMTLPKLVGLAGKVGYEQHVIKSGAMKDIGNPLRDLTDAERKVLQGIVDDLYGRFLDAVVTGRDAMAKREDARGVADGRVFSATEAHRLGLIDRVCYLDESLAALMKAAGIAHADVVTYAKRERTDANLYSATAARRVGPLVEMPLAASGVFHAAGFHYLWLPGR